MSQAQSSCSDTGDDNESARKSATASVLWPRAWRARPHARALPVHVALLGGDLALFLVAEVEAEVHTGDHTMSEKWGRQWPRSLSLSLSPKMLALGAIPIMRLLGVRHPAWRLAKKAVLV